MLTANTPKPAIIIKGNITQHSIT